MNSKRKSSAISEEEREEKQPRAVVRPKMRQDLLHDSAVQKLQNAWENSNSEIKGVASRHSERDACVPDDDVEVIGDPFRICVLKRFLSDARLCGALKDSFLELSLQRKESDLFSFYQSEDLSTIDDPEVAELLDFLETECRDWVRRVTGLALDGGVSATLSVYDHGDHLLCHDDKFEDRCVAFILYLNTDWRPHFGGELQIFNTHDSNLPKEVVRSILPENNTFVFFEVADNSFHQVAEVLVENDLRVTVNGWFHGAGEMAAVPAPVYPTHPGPRDLAVPPVSAEGTKLEDFVASEYLSQRSEFRSQFEADSEMILPSFLRKDMYDQIAEELCQSGVAWSPLYLPDHRRYEVLEAGDAGGSLRRLLHLLGSSSFFSFLEDLTGLSLTPGAGPVASGSQAGSGAPAGPRGHCEVQRWRSGCYSLAKDSDFQLPSGVLEVRLFFNCGGVSDDGEGSITYIAANEEEKVEECRPGRGILVGCCRSSRWTTWQRVCIETTAPPRS
ncbi:prolyl 3-hydroxylase OGFOD1 isoform X2 [Bacillus rossius redtenbacheri]|uniref:prolyl 3-hydroxylase OGFOD1 isoform X2 n=1 Tax=Bacillus rossius redtenbacheri TaxID=93214 RepID=UPI002FDE1061